MLLYPALFAFAYKTGGIRGYCRFHIYNSVRMHYLKHSASAAFSLRTNTGMCSMGASAVIV